MEYYGLVITVSNDGFTRVWNLHADCLGEMKLPNISDDMKDNQLHCVKNGLWNLIMERKVLSNEDQATAEKLVQTIVKQTKESVDIDRCDIKPEDGLMGFSPSIQRIADILATIRDPKSSEQEQNRISQLQSLVEAPSSIDSVSQPLDILDTTSLMSAFTLRSQSLYSLASPVRPLSIAELSFGSQTVISQLCIPFSSD